LKKYKGTNEKNGHRKAYECTDALCITMKIRSDANSLEGT
jgi:hypothetical protein